VLSQITLVALVIFTWFFTCAAAPYRETGAVLYPLPLVFQKVWGSGWFLKTFSAVAMAGLVVSYSGIIYAASRQSFSLGRAGYFPRALGAVHATRRTPQVSLIVWTSVVITFILIGHFREKAAAAAILISTLAAVIWYVLAMMCLLILRRKEPALPRPYLTPVFPWMPIFVAVLAAFSGYLYMWTADLTSPAGLAAVRERLSQQASPIELLVNNAGVGAEGSFADLPADSIEGQVSLNVTALVALTHAALPSMLRRRHGGVLNVSSVAGFVALPGSAVYGATKAFVTSFTESLACEVAGQGVHVTALCPGFTRTESSGAADALPRLALLDAGRVARAGLDAVAAGRVICVPGAPYKAVTGLTKIVPRRVIRAAAKAMQRP